MADEVKIRVHLSDDGERWVHGQDLMDYLNWLAGYDKVPPETQRACATLAEGIKELIVQLDEVEGEGSTIKEYYDLDPNGVPRDNCHPDDWSPYDG